MADPALLNIQAFQPFDGGNGLRVTAGTGTGSTPYRIPGLSGGTDGNENKRVLITNGGLVSAFLRMGPSSTSADLNSLEILPGCAYLLTPPAVNPSGVWFAVCTEAGTTTVGVAFGYGT